MCNFYNKNYILAAFDFKKYYDLNINKKYIKVEGGLYNYIYCLYISSLDYNLDQSNTYNAIYGIKEFIKNYPNSYKLSNIKIFLYKLLKKVEKKEFEIAKINYNLKLYKSAFLNFKNFIIEYPNSKLGEQAFFYAIHAQIKLAIDSKNQEIRNKILEKAIFFYHKFKNKYIISKIN